MSMVLGISLMLFLVNSEKICVEELLLWFFLVRLGIELFFLVFWVLELGLLSFCLVYLLLRVRVCL